MAKAKITQCAEDPWESEALGDSQAHARKVSPEVAAQIEESLSLQMISIRLDRSLIDSFKLLADFHGVGYQPLMRDALKRFADAEMKSIVSGVVKSQKSKKLASRDEDPPSQGPEKKAA